MASKDSDGSTRSLFPTLKTVTVGTYKDVDDLLSALSEKGYDTSEVRKLVLQDAFTLSDKEQRLDLVAPTTINLGYPYCATTEDLVKNGLKHFGLGRVPVEAVIKLRLIYTDQPDGEWCIGMHKPIFTSVNNPKLLRLGCHDKSLWIDTECGKPNRNWIACDNRRFIFVRDR